MNFRTLIGSTFLTGLWPRKAPADFNNLLFKDFTNFLAEVTSIEFSVGSFNRALLCKDFCKETSNLESVRSRNILDYGTR